MLNTVESRLQKGLSVGKDLKLEHRLRESTTSIITTDMGDIMDLKADIVGLKNKLFLSEQLAREVGSQKNIAVKKLENQNFEERKRLTDEINAKD